MSTKVEKLSHHGTGFLHFVAIQRLDVGHIYTVGRAPLWYSLDQGRILVPSKIRQVRDPRVVTYWGGGCPGLEVRNPLNGDQERVFSLNGSEQQPGPFDATFEGTCKSDFGSQVAPFRYLLCHTVVPVTIPFADHCVTVSLLQWVPDQYTETPHPRI